MPTRHVFLIPGFFGFVNFGRLTYFRHVREHLESSFDHAGTEVHLHRVRVSPTASLRTRAAELAAAVAERAPTGEIHLVGHSSGGLDARMVAAPGANFESVDCAAFADRLRSVTCVATPHAGTPLASFFSGAMGRQALRLLSATTVYTLRRGRLPLSLLTRLLRVFVSERLQGHPVEEAVDHLYRELVDQVEPLLDEADHDRVVAFFDQVLGDQALIPQLTPESAELIAAVAGDREGVRYGDVAVCARRPDLGARLGAGLRPMAQGTYALFEVLYRLTARRPTRASIARPAALSALHQALGESLEPTDNDGVVPVFSQLHGELLCAVRGDHLDVIGHFAGPEHDPPHHDWLSSRSDFNRGAFDRVWSRVAEFVLGG